MSRSVEEQLLLEQRIEAMKRKNEELRRRHMEVEADKLSAAKQNALVSVNVRHDDDWCPGRHDENPRPDRHPQNQEATQSNYDRHDNRNQRFDPRRSRHEGHRDESHSYNRHNEDSSPKYRSNQNFHSSPGKRSDYPRDSSKPDKDRYHGTENRRSGDWSDRSQESSSNWANQSYSGRKSNSPSRGTNFSRGNPSGTFTSKVYKNSSMGPDREKRPTYRLAEGDGPPPDPSYSFLGDSMRDSPESSDRKRSFVNRRGFSKPRGRGGQTWNNRGYNDSSKDGLEDREEGHSRNHEDSKQLSYDAWRRERSLIDQERINRQKTSDGSWSREWDNDKVFQEGAERPQQWRRGNQTQSYNRGNRGYGDDSGSSTKFYTRTKDGGQRTYGHNESEEPHGNSPRETKYIRRGRFSHYNKEKDFSGHRNGSVEQKPLPSEREVSKEMMNATLTKSNAPIGAQRKVSQELNVMGQQTERSVEGDAQTLKIKVRNEGKSSEGKNVDQKHHVKRPPKGKRSRIHSSTSTGTTGTAEEDDGSWEDVTSEEENVSVITELQTVSHRDVCSSKSLDLSSGPESLDPIPAPGKEDEFLWDDFHPAGFQDNATLVMDAEAAYKALLDEKAKQEVMSDSLDHAEKIIDLKPQVSFKLDKIGDEVEIAKLDPLLVTTQIVQAEVDCMSLTSLPIDVSLPYEVSQVAVVMKTDNEVPSANTKDSEGSVIVVRNSVLSAEEISGPVSILDVTSAESGSFEPVPVNLLNDDQDSCESNKIENSDRDQVTLNPEEVGKEGTFSPNIDTTAGGHEDLKSSVDISFKESESKDLSNVTSGISPTEEMSCASRGESSINLDSKEDKETILVEDLTKEKGREALPKHPEINKNDMEVKENLDDEEVKKMHVVPAVDKETPGKNNIDSTASTGLEHTVLCNTEKPVKENIVSISKCEEKSSSEVSQDSS